MYCRRSVAAIICPLAPFLVPARASRAILEAEQRLNRIAATRSYAKYVKPAGQSHRQSSKFLRQMKQARGVPRAAAFQDGVSQTPIHHFRNLLASEGLDAVMRMYPDMIARSLLTGNDTMRIVRLLHNQYRLATEKRAVLPKLLKYAEVLVHDLQNRTLPPHRAASLHLISFFKESQEYSKGYELWLWLVWQDHEYVDAAVFGAAIELLACHGESLHRLEELYVHALKRFPGNFAEYHLSPEAILPDRAQQMTIKGLPMSLLQGILTARLLHGNWRKAYLALDTAFRLFPTQVPPRFIELFMYERPISEAYTVFLMACRSGIVLKPQALTHVLDELAVNQYSKTVLPLTAANVTMVNGMLNATYAYIGAGGVIGGRHLSVLVKGFTGLLSSYVSAEGSSGSRSIDASITDAARGIITTFAHSGVPPIVSTFNTLITMAGKSRRADLIQIAIQDMISLKIQPNEVTYRAVLAAAGNIGNTELVESSWKTLVALSESEGRQPDAKDWQALAKAARRVSNTGFVQQQMAELSHGITPSISVMVQRELERHESQGWALDGQETPDTATSQIQLQQLMARVSRIVGLLNSQKLLNFYQAPIAMFLDPSKELGAEEDLRLIHEELSTDPGQSHPNNELPKAMSPTGFPLDELRFENWATINELLAEAERFDTVRKAAIEKAIATGSPTSKSIAPLTTAKPGAITGMTDSAEPTTTGNEESVNKDTTRADLRQKILRLRGSDNPSARCMRS